MIKKFILWIKNHPFRSGLGTIFFTIGLFATFTNNIKDIKEFWTPIMMNIFTGTEEPTQLSLSGIVTNEEGYPLDMVIISLPDFHLSDTTDHLGTFEFKSLSFDTVKVNLVATREGFQASNFDPLLGSQINFVMKRLTK